MAIGMTRHDINLTMTARARPGGAVERPAYGTAPLHALEHATFIFFGCLMWMPVFGPLPKPEWFSAGWKVGYVIAVRFTGAILGNVLMWSGTVLYPVYAPGERYWGISPLADQSTAGTLMTDESRDRWHHRGRRSCRPSPTSLTRLQSEGSDCRRL